MTTKGMHCPSQNELIMNHLKENGSITSLDAMKLYGIMRLSARIADLKSLGFAFDTETVTLRNRYGQTCRVTAYSLAKEGVPV